MTTTQITRVALLAAVYAGLTVALPFLSYGPFFQLRVSEALTVLPYVMPSAIPALIIGCLVANMAGGLGALDIIFGSAATGIAAVLTRLMPHRLLAPLPPVIINAVIVGYYLSVLAGVPFHVTAGYVALGQTLACYGIGYPLLVVVRDNKALLRLLRGG